MKIFYKYIFCLLVYVIPFASTSPFAPFTGEQTSLLYGEYLASFDKELFFGNDNSSDIRKAIIEQTEGSEAKPMSIPKWDHASFGEVLEEVAPSFLLNDYGDVKKEIEDNKSIKQDITNQYTNIIHQTSIIVMNIIKGKSKAGHIAVARVILEDGRVITLPHIFLSGTETKDKIVKSFSKEEGINGQDVFLNTGHFYNIFDAGKSCDSKAEGIPHSERAIGLYLQKNMSDILSKIRVIQIKNVFPMCVSCVLFWHNKAHIDYSNVKFCGKKKGIKYNIWDGFEPGTTLLCSAYSIKVSFEDDTLKRIMLKSNRPHISSYTNGLEEEEKIEIDEEGDEDWEEEEGDGDWEDEE